MCIRKQAEELDERSKRLQAEVIEYLQLSDSLEPCGFCDALELPEWLAEWWFSRFAVFSGYISKLDDRITCERKLIDIAQDPGEITLAIFGEQIRELREDLADSVLIWVDIKAMWQPQTAIDPQAAEAANFAFQYLGDASDIAEKIRTRLRELDASVPPRELPDDVVAFNNQLRDLDRQLGLMAIGLMRGDPILHLVAADDASATHVECLHAASSIYAKVIALRDACN